MSQASSTQSPLKILLVENSRTARAVLMRMLESHGYQVESVASGTEAISAILESDFDLVIMDVFLPQMNGYEAAQHIRGLESHKSNIPLVAFTSSVNERDKKICLDAGMNEYIIKSDDNKELLEILNKYQNLPKNDQQAS
ncbi:MAG: response regulator [Candidatus Berkiella sp.]